MKKTDTEKVIRMIMDERARQNEIWGADITNHPFEWMSILGEEYGELCQAVNESCFENGKHPELGGAENVIKEAVQVAAVAVAIIEQFSESKGEVTKWVKCGRNLGDDFIVLGHECSKCGDRALYDGRTEILSKFCPHCGAKLNDGDAIGLRKEW